MSTTREIIDHLHNGDLNKMREAFSDAMRPYVAQTLEAKRLEVAATLVQEPVKEDVSEENLQELSYDTMIKYKRQSKADAEEGLRSGEYEPQDRKFKNRVHGIRRASHKLNKAGITHERLKNEENLQELSTKKKMEYIAKAARSTKDREKGIDKAVDSINKNFKD